MIKRILRWAAALLYRFEAHNESVLKTPGPVLLLPNHVSWWDWLFIGVCLEDDWRFVTSAATAEVSWVHRKMMVNRRTFPVDMTSPYAVKHMAEYLQKGGRLVLFPEGRISSTGSLMKLFDGTGFLIAKTNAKVITGYLRGARRLPFSRNAGQKQWFPKVSAHFSSILQPPSVHGMSVAKGRALLTEWVRDQMIRQQFETENAFGPKTLPEAIVETARLMPAKAVVQDISLKSLTYRRLLTGAALLARQWERLPRPEHQRIGVLLPNTNTMPVVLLSLWASGRVPAVLNYTTGTAVMLSCCRVAGLKQIVTSRVFLEKARLDANALTAGGLQLLCLEDVRTAISGSQKVAMSLRNLIRPRLPCPVQESNSAGVILFTSGSEGDPKAVELSHGNLLANIRQMCSVIDLTEQDRFFNALPLFHSFGLTIGLFLPLAQGVFTFLYISPLHYRVVPSAFYNLNCTILFGTNTFLSRYARKAHPYDFHTLRYVFAGAEKLQDTTLSAWMTKFGVRILEGYGATECSPCVAVNVPMRLKPGTAGQFLPGIEHRLEHVEGIEGNGSDTGRLFVRGHNIMRAYLNPEANAKFQALGGWYDTGDIVRVDPEGYMQVLGRLKRFAKVSGEMVSLAAVEDALSANISKYGLKFGVAIVTQPDVDRGEKLVAVTNESKLTLEDLRDAVRARGLSNLAVPRAIKVVHELPRLGTGKINHRALEKMLNGQ